MINVSPMRPFEHVVIDAGTVTQSTTTADVGKFMYFVDYHDAEGGVVHDYAGASHEMAAAAAAAWGAPVFDLSQGRGGAS